jgi:hypothetical protein
MIIGNCKDESTLFTQNQALFNLDDAGLREALVKAGTPDDKVDPLLRLYKRDHPTETPSDLYFRISADRGARRNAVRQAELKIAQGKGNVYIYYFHGTRLLKEASSVRGTRQTFRSRCAWFFIQRPNNYQSN